MALEIVDHTGEQQICTDCGALYEFDGQYWRATGDYIEMCP